MASQFVSNFTDFNIGRYFTPPHTSMSSPSHNGASASAAAFPYVPAINMVVDQLGVYSNGSTGDAGATDMIVRVGLYDATSLTNPYPNALLADTGNITVNTVGIQVVTFSPTITLTKGYLYWFMTKKQNTPSNAAASFACVAAAQKVPWMPYQSVDDGTNAFVDQHYPLTGAVATGTLPNPYTAGATPNANPASYILPWFRLASIG